MFNGQINYKWTFSIAFCQRLPESVPRKIPWFISFSMFFSLKWPWPDMARYGHLRPFKDVYPMFRIWVPGGRIQQDPFQDPTSPHSRWVFSAGDDQTWRPLAQLFPWFLAQLFTLWGWKKSEILHVFCILKQHHVIWIPLWALLVIVGSPTNREEIPMFCESVLVIKLHAL